MISPTLSTPDPTRLILVVEDSRVDRELIGLLLRNATHEVAATSSLADTLSFLKARQPDVIVLDEHLEDGLASAHLDRIRALAPLTPLVFVSGRLDLASALGISQRGVAAIFNKPVNPKSLVAKVRELMDGKVARQTDPGSASDTASLDSAATYGGKAANPGTSSIRWDFLPGSSPAHRDFGERLAKVRDFRSTLLCVGRPGCAFFPVARDMHASSALRHAPLLEFTVACFSRAAAAARLARLVTSPDTITLALKYIDAYSPVQAETLADLIEARDEFAPYAGRLRFLFSAGAAFLETPSAGPLRSDLAERLANLTIALPGLDELREDRVALARRLLAEIGADSLALTPATVDWLEQKSWPGDYRQFRRVVLLSAAASSGVLDPDFLESAYEVEPTLPETAYDICVDPPVAPETAASSPEPSPAAVLSAPPGIPPVPPASANPRRPRIGAYDFSRRLEASLDAAGSTPAPVSPAHPRFAPKPGSASR